MMNLSKTVSTVKNVITANSPQLLVGAAITGVVSTAYFAAKGGYKARGIVDAAEKENGGPLELQDKIKLTWLCYAVPGVTAISACASVIGVHKIHTQRYAALSSLYAIGMNKLDEVRENAEELLGPKKAQQLNDRVAQANVDRDPVNNHEVVILEGGTQLMHDDLSGRWFMGSVAIVEKAVSEINLMLAESGDASLNDFYDFVGLRPIPLGQNLGWSGARISPQFGSANTADGRSAVSYWFLEAPKENMGITR